MTPERWKRVTAAFDQLAGAAAAERTARLAELDREFPGLGAEVASLIEAAHAATADGFLDSPPPLSAELFEGGGAPGDRLGPYELIDELGHGGMGTVYRARRADGAFAKEVAVKVVRRGMDTEMVVRRFVAEREILAGLEHPNIARLLDGGQADDGRPYFVMELAGGLPLDRWCSERTPSLPRRLEVFLALCDAVQRAHRSLVIHRDLKPANVMVDDDGVPRLLDFGIAKLLVPGTDVTRDEQRLATPAYASPEQLRGDPVTTSTDVHGLGMLLHVMLAGRPPFEGEGSALVRRICEEAPPRPSTLAVREGSLVRGDLDTIVAMALRKEPERRYASVADLADDVRRHLSGLPVRARGDDLGYRARRFARRHWVPMVGATLLVGSLVLGIVSTRRQAAAARRERALAEQRLVQVRGLAGTLIFELDDAIAPLAGSMKARQLVVERAVKYLDALAADGDGDSVAVARELTVGYRKLGDVLGSPAHANLGDRPAAEAAYRKAVAVTDRWLAQVPGDYDASLERSTALDRLSALQWDSGNLDSAIDLEKQSLAAVAGLAATPEVERTRAGTEAGIGDIYLEREDFVTARAQYQRARLIYERLAADGNARDRGALSSVMIKIGDSHRFAGELDAAEAAYTTALAMREQLAKEAPDNAAARRDLSLSVTRMGKIYKARKDHAGALVQAERALALDEAALTAAPDDVRGQRDVAASALDAAQLNDTLGDTLTGPTQREHRLRARAQFERALAIFDQLLASGRGHGESDAKMPAGIRQRIAAIDEQLAAAP